MSTVQLGDFRRAVFDACVAHPDGLTDGQGAPAGKRFDVYRNNVIVSLKEAMRGSFPCIEKLIGAENFANICGVFVRQHPPSDPRLVRYGAHFPAFLATFAPLQHLGYLADVARLELALIDSYHAADADPLDPSIFGTVAPDVLAQSYMHLAPSVRLIRSSWPVLDIWHYNMTPGAPQPSNGQQDVLILRPEFDPAPHVLAAGAASLIEHISSGARLGDALEAAHETAPDFDFPALLTLLLTHGGLSGLSTPKP